ncbi:MAG: ABC transporter permease [Alphaproteobacteria bacterium]|nr:ABC transporter permease [Alphaproteobacteria bacterium]MCB9699467.1 ABC transporter permease [Alphaproteobacteria bacterium]
MSHRPPAWVLAIVAAVYVFLHAPLLVLVVFSFNESKYSVEWTGFTLHWYQRLLERHDIVDGLVRSVAVGLSSTALSTVFGTLMALALARHRFRGRSFVEALLYVPIVTPEIVVGISLLILYVLLGWPLGLTSITIAHVAFNISFVTVVVHARLQGMDGSLEEAAMILGADEITAFWRVTVPQLWPGILSGAMLAFTMSFDDYVITSFVSGTGSQTLPIVVYTMVRKNIEPSINAISTIVLVVTTVMLIVSDRLSRDKPLSAD